MKERREVESLHRDFSSGRLMSYGWKHPAPYIETPEGFFPNFQNSVRFSQLIHEPLTDEDRDMIGDLPIPPVLAKVDL